MRENFGPWLTDAGNCTGAPRGMKCGEQLRRWAEYFEAEASRLIIPGRQRLGLAASSVQLSRLDEEPKAVRIDEFALEHALSVEIHFDPAIAGHFVNAQPPRTDCRAF